MILNVHKNVSFLGLPHCHMLLILDNDDKIREPDDVNTVVCA